MSNNNKKRCYNVEYPIYGVLGIHGKIEETSKKYQTKKNTSYQKVPQKQESNPLQGLN